VFNIPGFPYRSWPTRTDITRSQQNSGLFIWGSKMLSIWVLLFFNVLLKMLLLYTEFQGSWSLSDILCFAWLLCITWFVEIR